LIDIRNLTKKYDSIIAVDNITLRVLKGEHLCLLGPSGCGKTTLLRLIAGFDKPDSGKIIINEKVVSFQNKLTPPHERKIGMVFQDLALWPHMTVRENINFGLSKGLSKKEKFEKIKEVLNLVNLNAHLNYYPHQLSGGEQQRVALARTLIIEPKILLFDEPLSSLDFHLKKEIERVITELQKKLNITTIYVTHNQDEAIAMADRIAIMNRGCIEQIGTLEELRKKPRTEFVKNFIRN
jgi:ABC-type Fe3+/spermidine/putrescine transport system ATPase subunit